MLSSENARLCLASTTDMHEEKITALSRNFCGEEIWAGGIRWRLTRWIAKFSFFNSLSLMMYLTTAEPIYKQRMKTFINCCKHCKIILCIVVNMFISVLFVCADISIYIVGRYHLQWNKEECRNGDYMNFDFKGVTSTWLPITETGIK